MSRHEESRGAETVLKWLKLNGVNLGALSDHDRACLRALVEIAAVWVRGDVNGRGQAANAFGFVLVQMQMPNWWLAFHVVAHVGDWSHRCELWKQCKLPWIRINGLSGGPECGCPVSWPAGAGVTS